MATVKEDILKVLKGIDRPISTGEIAKLAKRNPGSVRVNLRILLREGKIIQEFRGHYSYKPIQGVGFDVPPRFQNLFVTADRRVGGERIGVRYEDLGRTLVIPIGGDGSQIRVIFGYKNNKINWTLKAPRGVDYYGIELATIIVNGECEIRGYSGVLWMLRNIEVLRDNENIRLEGISSVTMTDFQNKTLEKYYNRPGGVRREIRAVPNMPLSNLSAIIYGGQSSYQMLQGIGVLVKKIDGMVEVGKGTNRLLVDFGRSFKAFADSNLKVLDRLDSIEKSKK